MEVLRTDWRDWRDSRIKMFVGGCTRTEDDQVCEGVESVERHGRVSDSLGEEVGLLPEPDVVVSVLLEGGVGNLIVFTTTLTLLNEVVRGEMVNSWSDCFFFLCVGMTHIY